MSDFFQNIVGKVGSALGVDVQAFVQQQVQSLLQPQTIQALVDRAEEAGLGDKVRSWVSDNSNLPVTPDEIRTILGSDVVHEMVQKTGLPADGVLAALAHCLPQAVDSKKPDGVMPAGDKSA